MEIPAVLRYIESKGGGPIRYRILITLGLAAALLAPAAQAGLIGTEEAAAQQERARVKALVERPELAAGLAKMGIAPQDAAARVDAMSDAEVLELAGRLDAALAGGQLTNEQLLLIIIVLLLVIILL
jgi:hypothetical protein